MPVKPDDTRRWSVGPTPGTASHHYWELTLESAGLVDGTSMTEVSDNYADHCHLSLGSTLTLTAKTVLHVVL